MNERVVGAEGCENIWSNSADIPDVQNSIGTFASNVVDDGGEVGKISRVQGVGKTALGHTLHQECYTKDVVALADEGLGSKLAYWST